MANLVIVVACPNLDCGLYGFTLAWHCIAQLRSLLRCLQHTIQMPINTRTTTLNRYVINSCRNNTDHSTVATKLIMIDTDYITNYVAILPWLCLLICMYIYLFIYVCTCICNLSSVYTVYLVTRLVGSVRCMVCACVYTYVRGNSNVSRLT